MTAYPGKHGRREYLMHLACTSLLPISLIHHPTWNLEAYRPKLAMSGLGYPKDTFTKSKVKPMGLAPPGPGCLEGQSHLVVYHWQENKMLNSGVLRRKDLAVPTTTTTSWNSMA